MTKQKLIDTLAEEVNITKKQADLVLTKLVRIIEKTIKTGEKVSITGFGTFNLSQRKARFGIDPQTAKKIKIPAMAMPRFRAGKRLKEIVRS